VFVVPWILLSYSSSEVSSDEAMGVKGDNFGWELILTIS
jgi:hypothetical protein